LLFYIFVFHQILGVGGWANIQQREQPRERTETRNIFVLVS